VKPVRTPRPADLRAEDGITIVEVLVAVFVLAVGILGFMYNFDSSRKLTLVAERQTSAAHRAQQEVERLQAVPYSELRMTSAPTHVSESCSSTSNPDACVSSGSEPTYQYDPSSTTTEKLVLATTTPGECASTPVEGCGVVKGEPIAWTGEHTSGYIYEFVSWHEDTTCGTKCEEEKGKNYKRITVVVTVTVPSGTHAVAPIRVSTLIADPNAGGINAKNPLASPTTKCGESKESCTNGIGTGKPQQWFLHDSPPETAVAPTASHTLHSTVAPSSTSCTATTTTTACPKPDLMDGSSPPEAATTLYDYSTDQDAAGNTDEAGHGGRALTSAKAACSGMAAVSSSPSENPKGELWVTTPLSAETKLTGVGALSIYTQTLGGTATAVTLCLGIYDVPNSLTNLVKSPPTLIGYSEYAPDAWPQSLTNLSFLFEKLTGASSLTIKGEHRIGLRLWTATGDIAVAYDTLAQRSTLQLNTE
jgi:Tfp pilus assembly protein PilV